MRLYSSGYWRLTYVITFIACWNWPLEHPGHCPRSSEGVISVIPNTIPGTAGKKEHKEKVVSRTTGERRTRIIKLTLKAPSDVVARRFSQEARNLSADEARIAQGGIDGCRTARDLPFADEMASLLIGTGSRQQANGGH